MDAPTRQNIVSQLNRIPDEFMRDIFLRAFSNEEFAEFPSFLAIHLAQLHADPGTFDAGLSRLGQTLFNGMRSLSIGQRIPVKSHPDTPTLSRFSTAASGANSPNSPSGRNRAHIIDTLQRDNYQCVITGRDKNRGFPIEVAHIIPLSLSGSAECREDTFWKTLEMFYGLEITEKMWNLAGAGTNRANHSNLLSLDSSCHKMFDTHEISFNAHKSRAGDRFNPTDDFNDDMPCPAYEIQIVFARPLRVGMISTAKGLNHDRDPAVPVSSGDYFAIDSSTDHPLPHPLLLNCRAAVIDIMRRFKAAGGSLLDDDLQEPDDISAMDSVSRFVEMYGWNPVTPKALAEVAFDPKKLTQRLDECRGWGVV